MSSMVLLVASAPRQVEADLCDQGSSDGVSSFGMGSSDAESFFDCRGRFDRTDCRGDHSAHQGAG